jgi:hypothetical protein
LLINCGSFSKASAPPLFLEDENIFQKSARVVAILLQFRVQPGEPIFEKCSHPRERGGAAMVQEAPLKIYARGVVAYFYFSRTPRERALKIRQIHSAILKVPDAALIL